MDDETDIDWRTDGSVTRSGFSLCAEADACAAGSCACEGNYAGHSCRGDCGDYGTSDGSTCTCTGNFIGTFCETECPIPDCGAHGNLTGSIEAAREANSCSALSCVCEGNFIGEFCQYGLSTVPAQCAAGMGSHGVVYNGAAYRTLDDAPPEGDDDGDPNGGCQRIEYYYGDNEPNYLPLPPGYALAPPDADTIAVIAAHGWSTECAVAADGWSWYSGSGDRCSSSVLASSGGSHTVTSCWRRVLARCP